jgi:hypothetical protein
MKNLKSFVDSFARRLSVAEWFSNDTQAVRQVELADEYAATLGLHLSPDEQLARFKRATEGAPVVRRTPRRVSTV